MILGNFGSLGLELVATRYVFVVPCCRFLLRLMLCWGALGIAEGALEAPWVALGVLLGRAWGSLGVL